MKKRLFYESPEADIVSVSLESGFGDSASSQIEIVNMSDDEY